MAHDPVNWQPIGGHPALDLANTVSWRGDPRRRLDRLSGADRLLDWWRQLPRATDVDREAGLGSPGSLAWDAGDAAGDALEAVRTLRDALIRLLDAQVDGEPLDAGDLQQVQDAWRQALDHSALDPQLPSRWQVRVGGISGLQHELALQVGALLTGPQLERLRRCDGAGCGWFFLDTSRNHTRRWCDPADCGNRARVRRYAGRHSDR